MRNLITNLDSLPETLEILNCENNPINSLDNLSNKLKELLYLNRYHHIHLDNLPSNTKNVVNGYWWNYQ